MRHGDDASAPSHKVREEKSQARLHSLPPIELGNELDEERLRREAVDQTSRLGAAADPPARFDRVDWGATGIDTEGCAARWRDDRDRVLSRQGLSQEPREVADAVMDTGGSTRQDAYIHRRTW